MKVEIEYYIEIPLTITCIVEKGELRTNDHPGYGAKIVDLEYKFDVDKELKAEKHLIETAIWDEVENMKEQK